MMLLDTYMDIHDYLCVTKTSQNTLMISAGPKPPDFKDTTTCHSLLVFIQQSAHYWNA